MVADSLAAVAAVVEAVAGRPSGGYLKTTGWWLRDRIILVL